MPGVTHIDATDLSLDAIEKVQDLVAIQQVAISGLGYYPNLLSADRDRVRARGDAPPPGDRRRVGDGRGRGEHVRRPQPGAVGGRQLAAVPGGLAAAHRPRRGPQREGRHRELPDALHPRRVARRQEPGDLAGDLAADVRGHPQPQLRPELRPVALRLAADGLPRPPGRVPRSRIFHVHAKDARIDRAALDQHGVLAYPKLWHTPKIPGLGDVRWGAFFAALSDIGYDGDVAIEVEDRAFEGSLELRLQSLIISRRHLIQYLQRIGRRDLHVPISAYSGPE